MARAASFVAALEWGGYFSMVRLLAITLLAVVLLVASCRGTRPGPAQIPLCSLAQVRFDNQTWTRDANHRSMMGVPSCVFASAGSYFFEVEDGYDVVDGYSAKPSNDGTLSFKKVNGAVPGPLSVFSRIVVTTANADSLVLSLEQSSTQRTFTARYACRTIETGNGVPNATELTTCGP